MSVAIDDFYKGIYDFSSNKDYKIFFFSDEEGGAPFPKASELTELSSKTGKEKEVLDTLNSSLVFDENGLITEIKKNTVLAFTGDLTDRSYYDIRILRNMIQMKVANRGRVILIGGNRDFNKIRLADELDFTVNGIDYFNDKTELINLDNIWNLCSIVEAANEANNGTFKFKLNSQDILKRLKKNNRVTPWDNKNSFPENLDRVDANTLLNTFGITNDSIEARYKEMNELYNNTVNGTVTQNFKRALYCITSILFSRVCQSFVVDNLFRVPKDSFSTPNPFEYLNGLYLKYINQCHILALIKSFSTNTILSHAGMVKEITSPILLNKKLNKTNTDLSTIIANVNDEVRNIYTMFLSHNLEAKNSIIDKFVFMTADCKEYDHEITDEERKTKTYTGNMTFDSNDAPIVNGNRKDELMFALGGGRGGRGGRRGGGWQDDRNDILVALSQPSGTLINYNIYGHKPCGVVPTVSGITTKHICLDISKAEESAFVNQSKSFAFFYLDNLGPRVLGRFVVHTETVSTFNQTVIGFKFNSNQTVYYNKTLEEYISEKESKSVPIKVKGVSTDTTVEMYKITDTIFTAQNGYEIFIVNKPTSTGGAGKKGKKTGKYDGFSYKQLRQIAINNSIKTTRDSDGKLKTKDELIASIKRKRTIKP